MCVKRRKSHKSPVIAKTGFDIQKGIAFKLFERQCEFKAAIQVKMTVVRMPRDCDPPTVAKADADAQPILMATIQSDKRSLLELSEIADLTVKEQLQTISNVSSVEIWGEKRYSMRLWLDPAKMAGYGITPTDIKNALDRENVELPSGSIEGNTTELTIRTMGLMHTTQEFNDLVIREDAGRIIRLRSIYHI